MITIIFEEASILFARPARSRKDSRGAREHVLPPGVAPPTGGATDGNRQIFGTSGGQRRPDTWTRPARAVNKYLIAPQLKLATRLSRGATWAAAHWNTKIDVRPNRFGPTA